MSRLATLALALALVGALVATPLASGAATGLGDTAVDPATVTTGATTTLDLSVEATGVNTSDGTTGATVTVSAPAAIDLSGATADAPAVTPNATNVNASVDAAANTVTVSWDDDTGVDAETVAVSVRVTNAVVDRSGTHELTAAVDADADSTTDVSGPVGTVTASTAGRTVTEGDSLFLGEEDVDLTALAGVAPAGDSQQFYGVGGEAEGTAATADDTADADVTLGNGFAVGTYNRSSSAGTADLTVERPRVRTIEVYPGESTGETDVGGSSIPASVETLTVEPTFNFAPADDATLVVENEDGLDVTDELTDNATVAASKQTVQLDVGDLSMGTYTIRVEGATDLDHVNASTTVRVRSEARTVSLSRTAVTRGESTVATVSGAPGSVHHLRLSVDALREESATVPTARAVFGASEGVVLVDADSAANVVFVVVSLDENGFARVELDTERFDQGRHDIEVAPNATADERASVSLSVENRDVSLSAPATPTVGETVNVTGTAPGATNVKLYAEVGSEYVPLYADTDTADLAETRVDNDGSWVVDLDTRAVVDVPGRYHIAAVSDPGASALGSTARISESAYRDFEATSTTTVEVVDSTLSASISRTRIATTDEITVTGHAPGPGETARLYVVSPRGDVRAHDVDVAEDDSFEFDDASLDISGQYRILVVRPGRDAAFGFADGQGADAIQRELTGDETTTQAVAVVRDAHEGAGVDDHLVTLNVTATDPQVTIESVTRRDDELVVAGASNRENDTSVALDLLRGSDVAAVADATVNDSGRWRTAVDVANVADDEYTLRVETGDAIDTRSVRLGETVTATPETTETATATDTPTATPTATDRAVAADTATARETRTQTTGDGFGVGVALAALFLLALVSRRR